MDQLPLFVYGWGSMIHGQLGLGGIEEEQILNARLLNAISGKRVRNIAAGVDHTVFLMQDGLVYSCGNNDRGQLGHDKARRKPETVDALETQVICLVACGVGHSVAVNNSGQVFTWGDNELEQLGRVSTNSFTHTPRMVKELHTNFVIQVACGYQHTLALTDDGRLFSWGLNNSGQLGVDIPNADIQHVHQVTQLKGLALSQIAAGGRHSTALTVSGALFTWGHNRYGQLGVGDERDRKLPFLCERLRSLNVKYVTCGEDHTAVLTQDGGVFTFGAGMYGQLGHGSAQSEKLPRKVFELMGSVVTMIACGRRHTVAYVQSSDKLYTFGVGGNGQLGLGSNINRLSPTQLPQLPSAGPEGNGKVSAVSIFAGGDQCFLLAAQPPSQMSNSSVNVARDFRVPLDGSQVLTLTRNEVQRYCRMCEVEKPSCDSQSRIEKIFKSISCLNASFLNQNNQHYFCSMTNHGVSIDEAQQVFDVISSLKNKYIKQIILGAIENTVLTSLTETSPSDIEELRLYLTLPLLRYFEQPELYTTLICPFAFAVVFKLVQPLSKIIESWWIQLGSVYMLRLVQIFKSVLLHILNESSTQVEAVHNKRRYCLYICLEMLKKLYMANENSQLGQNGNRLVSYESFYISQLKDKVELRGDYICWLQSLGAQIPLDVALERSKLPVSQDGKTLLYCNYPFLFDGQAKTLILQVDGMIQMQKAVDQVNRHNIVSLLSSGLGSVDPVNPLLIIQVRRENLVQDTLSQLAKQHSVDFKKPLKVIFHDEEALDAGGVKKEFFLLLLKEILDPKYGMFKYFQESGLIWFNTETFETTEMYQLIGLVCGLAIYNFIIIDISLPTALYRKLLNRKVTLDDLKQLQPSVGRSMEQLLEYAGDDFEDVFGIAFEITLEVYGEVEVVQLIPNGSQINVTQANKQQFVDAYLDYVFNTSVREYFESFSRGFHKVCGGYVLDLFQPQELEAMVVGNENYDWDEFEKNTSYSGEFTPNHPTIRMFWDVFHRDLSLTDKKKFLLFLTGSDRIPILGMSAVKVSIQPVNVDERFLPVAHTCFNLLDLPVYSNREMMRRKLLQAIEHTHGFGLV